MINGRIKNIIFDFDGTLADTSPLIIATMLATIKILGLPDRNEAQCRNTIGLKLEDVPAALWPDADVSGSEFASVYRRIFNMLKHRHSVKCYEGVLETLHTLNSRGYNLAIASSRSHGSLDEYCTDFGLEAIFSSIVGGDDVKSGKPAPEPVLKICADNGWLPYETLVVGDAVVDMEMGRSAGAFTCAVTYGNQSYEQLQAASPDLTIDVFSDLTSL
ncbi:MAG: HAD family hydrolase [Muribaculaceae bacterium]|nr:HAD family hydrolase [Muribaculaceae bacterium]